MIGIDAYVRAYTAGFSTSNVASNGRMSNATREQFIGAVRDLVVQSLPESEREHLLRAKLVYGAGAGYYRGICFYKAWDDGVLREFVEIAATGEESSVQLAGTTIHELGHVLAGPVGHGAEWKRACNRLGLVYVEASGQSYEPEHFNGELWKRINALAWPDDGKPTFGVAGAGAFTGLPTFKSRPCPMGRGTRGGKFGPGSGSRLRKWTCAQTSAECRPVRVASDTWQGKCLSCDTTFKQEV